MSLRRLWCAIVGHAPKWSQETATIRGGNECRRLRRPARMSDQRVQRDKRIWLAVGILALVVVAYEIVGIDPAYVGIHSISFEAFFHPVLRFGIVLVAVGFIVWWLWHSSSRKAK